MIVGAAETTNYHVQMMRDILIIYENITGYRLVGDLRSTLPADWRNGTLTSNGPTIHCLPSVCLWLRLLVG